MARKWGTPEGTGPSSNPCSGSVANGCDGCFTFKTRPRETQNPIHHPLFFFSRLTGPSTWLLPMIGCSDAARPPIAGGEKSQGEIRDANSHARRTFHSLFLHVAPRGAIFPDQSPTISCSSPVTVSGASSGGTARPQGRERAMEVDTPVSAETAASTPYADDASLATGDAMAAEGGEGVAEDEGGGVTEPQLAEIAGVDPLTVAATITPAVAASTPIDVVVAAACSVDPIDPIAHDTPTTADGTPSGAPTEPAAPPSRLAGASNPEDDGSKESSGDAMALDGVNPEVEMKGDEEAAEADDSSSSSDSSDEDEPVITHREIDEMMEQVCADPFSRHFG